MNGKCSNNDKKARILAWSKENIPIKIICKRKGRARSTIMKLLSSAKGLPSNAVPKHKFGAGRRRKTSHAADTFLRIEIQQKPQLTALDVKNLHPELLQNVSFWTMQGSLQKDSGFLCCEAAKKPLLTESTKKQRIAIAKQHVHWTSEQWKKVIFSDESNFQVFRMDPPSFDTHHHLINLISGVKFQLLNTQIWSWFGELFLVK